MEFKPLKNTKKQKENLLGKLNSRLNISKERISELKERSVEINQYEEKRK